MFPMINGLRVMLPNIELTEAHRKWAPMFGIPWIDVISQDWYFEVWTMDCWCRSEWCQSVFNRSSYYITALCPLLPPLPFLGRPGWLAYNHRIRVRCHSLWPCRVSIYQHIPISFVAFIEAILQNNDRGQSELHYIYLYSSWHTQT